MEIALLTISLSWLTLAMISGVTKKAVRVTTRSLLCLSLLSTSLVTF